MDSDEDSPEKLKDVVEVIQPKKGKKGKKGKKAEEKKEKEAKVTSVSPALAKSKSKKKQKKAVEITFPTQISTEPFSRNLFLPSREMMQRMILRAATLKEKDKLEEPIIQEVRPYINVQNEDIMV